MARMSADYTGSLDKLDYLTARRAQGARNAEQFFLWNRGATMTIPITEQQLLAQSALPYFGRGNDDRAFVQRLAQVDPERFVDDAVRQGMAGLLYRRLLDAHAQHSLPDLQLTRLRRFYLATAAGNVCRMLDLKKILTRADQAKIPVVILKGMRLLASVYIDPGLRPMEDMDLWVMPGQCHRLTEALEDLGYQNDSLYPGTFKKGRTVLDIRTHLLDADRIHARGQLMGVDQDAVFQASIPIPIDGIMARGLTEADQVLFLCIHALKHDISRMIWLADILGIVGPWGEAEWQRLNKRAALWGQERSLAYPLYLIRRLFGVRFPLEKPMEKSGIHFGILEKYALRQRIHKKALPPWSPLVLFSTKKGLRRRLEYIFETLFPRPEILRQVFHQHSNHRPPALYLLRAAQLMSMPFARRP